MADAFDTNTALTDKILILLYRLKFGGAERVMLTLAGEMARRELNADIGAFEAEGEFAANVPRGVGLVSLGTLSLRGAARKLAEYIAEARPRAIIANGDRATVAAYLARRRAGEPRPKIVSVVHNDLVGAVSLPFGGGKIAAFVKKFVMRRVYGQVDRVVAVSRGAADSVTALTGYPRDRVGVIYNPLDIDGIRAAASEPVDHPWFDRERGDLPLIVSVGRLTAQKDFPTLLRAFAELLRVRPARLALIGEGEERPALERIIAELGISDNVALLGFQKNPHKFVARADLFVLSSVFEGLGMVLLEAMTVGTPIVSTDCPSGPAELLESAPDRLVPMRDPSKLAAAISRALDEGRAAPIPADLSLFSIDRALNNYLEAIR